jgi:flagellar protein FlbT
MPLKVELKPGERIIIGTVLLTNGDSRSRFTIEGDAPILREKDIITAADADTPARRIYLAVELMFLAGKSDPTITEYKELRNDFLQAAPSSYALMEAIDNEVLTGAFYKAIKAAKLLVAYERDLLNYANRRTSVRTGGSDDGSPS